MTDTTPTQQDRDALAKVLFSQYLGAGLSYTLADAILTSDWLAEHVRAKQAEAWQQGYDRACADIDWGRPRGTRKISPNPYEGSGS